ncbi:hypothetical protein BDA96_01G560200 [Sorghum bicolor]|uniref:Uncharacterized protein n=1 Tax=Sorghum bicolor TaxID=4558 RepID=A0A921V367_SORBI|nr:hypothetical protein BDA96_01G560200 [Sorghum bicolor]
MAQRPGCALVPDLVQLYGELRVSSLHRRPGQTSVVVALFVVTGTVAVLLPVTARTGHVGAHVCLN